MAFNYERIDTEDFRYDGYEIKTAYRVKEGNEVVGKVARSESNEWVVRNTEDKLWISYGKTRDEACNKAFTSNARFIVD